MLHPAAAARLFLEAVRTQHAPERAAVDADVLPRVLGVHWRRGDFAIQRAGQHETECSDVASGTELKPCPKRQIILSPAEFAISIQRHLAFHSCQVVFLATDASFDEIRELNSSLKGTPLLRFDPAALIPRVGVSAHHGASEAEHARETQLDLFGKPERAIMDTLICAFADALLATRLSIFSWNILEERWSASCRAWRPRLDTTYDAADSEVWSVFRASGGPQEVYSRAQHDTSDYGVNHRVDISQSRSVPEP